MEKDFLIVLKTKNGLISFWQKELSFMETAVVDGYNSRIKLKGYDKFLYSTEKMDDIINRIKTLIKNK